MESVRCVLIALIAAACGGSNDDKVVELPPASQIELCQTVIDKFCDPVVNGFEDYCAAPCATDGCAKGIAAGLVTAECGPTAADGTAVTVQDVEDCIDSLSTSDCLNRGGGCMFDVLDEACEI
jgi:hypothetical protein